MSAAPDDDRPGDLPEGGTVDVVVRLHDPARHVELGRCLFSLLGQRGTPVHVILAVQRFTRAGIAAAHEVAAPLLALRPDMSLTVLNFEEPVPRDARTHLLNLGLTAARGRYLGFLDFDDALYPEAYGLLAGRLRATEAAVAFASVRVVRADPFRQFLRIAAELPPPYEPGRSLRDLFRANFCPIHSFLLDRARIAPDALRFDTGLTWEEDYAFLLRLCAAHPADFALLGTRIGDYVFRSDGSNSIPLADNAARPWRYGRVRAAIEERRATTLVSPAILAANGLPEARAPMSIRAFLDATARGVAGEGPASPDPIRQEPEAPGPA